jgi:DNA-binding transcriptional LysR family regulator
MTTFQAGSKKLADIAIWRKSFAAVTDAGSFSAAAARIGSSQSTLSKHVAALEAHLQTRLFNRTTRSLTLTTDGARFYEKAMSALDTIEAAEASVGLEGEAEGILRLTAPLTLAESRLVAMLTRFMADNPRIEIDFTASDHALNLVADNLDLAVRVGQLADSRLIARKIGVARRIAVASPAYLERAGCPRHPQDLAQHQCIVYSLLGTGSRWTFEDGGAVEIRGNFRADSPNMVRAAAMAGLGIAVNARWLFEDALATGELVQVLPDHEPVRMPIHIVLPPGRYVPARTRSLIDFLSREFAADPLLAPDQPGASAP